jgi:hypothetical protein
MRFAMSLKSLAVIAAILVTAVGPQGLSAARASDCMAGDKIDGSTAEMARKKMESAGFQMVRDLEKGCDNFWHGKADKDGAAVNVVLSPQGNVMVEGN